MDFDNTTVAKVRSRLFARYRDPDVANGFHGPEWNDTFDTMLRHRSVRAFRDEPVPDGLVETLVAAAQSAPTSSNLQAWSVVEVLELGAQGAAGETCRRAATHR